MKVRRFFYTASSRSTHLHIQFGSTHSEGPVACGRKSSPGWSWWQKHRSKLPVCTQCIKAMARKVLKK